jgi:hypothetical protein
VEIIVSTLTVRGDTVIQVNKRFLQLVNAKKKIIYFIRCDKPLRYRYRRKSRIGYIGRTDRPSARPFESLRNHSKELLNIHGVRHIELMYVEGTPIRHVDISDKLERAFLHEFRNWFGTLPRANTAGSGRLELTDEGDYVSLRRVHDIILELS